MTSQIDADVLYGALAHHRRRAALSCLADREEPVDVPELAEAVVEAEGEGSRHDGSTGTVRSVHLSLYHCHLPKLAEAGLVEFDPVQNRVRYPNHPGVDELLDIHATFDDVRAV